MIVFGDPRYYWIADFAGMGMQRLNELYAEPGRSGSAGSSASTAM